MNTIFKIILFAAIGLIGCNGENKNGSEVKSKAEIGITRIRLSDLKGDPIDMKQYKGKILFLNFWATWCKPCLQEMPSIQRAMELLKNEEIEFLFASDESPDQIEKFRGKHDYKFNYVRAENLEELNIMALPTTFIFNADGELVFSEMGYRKWDSKKNIDLIRNITK